MVQVDLPKAGVKYVRRIRYVRMMNTERTNQNVRYFLKDIYNHLLNSVSLDREGMQNFEQPFSA